MNASARREPAKNYHGKEKSSTKIFFFLPTHALFSRIFDAQLGWCSGGAQGDAQDFLTCVFQFKDIRFQSRKNTVQKS
jgi:hypothetical protein